MIYTAPREEKRCPACESCRLSTLAVCKLHRVVDGRQTGFVSGCEACGLVFVNPLPRSEELAAFYGPAGEWSSDRQEEAPVGKRVKAPGSGSWVRMFDAIRDELPVTQPPAGARVLDFGCGNGKFLDVLQDCGWETFGIEPAIDRAFARHQRLTAVPGQPTFDLVLAHHVLEHVTNPLTLLRQFAAAVRPGGFLLVAVPRLDTLPVHRDYKYVIGRAHVMAYTAVCMEGLLARSGWQLVEAPQDEVRASGGRRTSARLRMVARRVERDIPVRHDALETARASLRAYYCQVAPRPFLERHGLLRLSARVVESRRRLQQWIVTSRAPRPGQVEH